MTDASTTRQRVLGLLREDGSAMTATQIADRLAVHPNTVRFHLDKLIERGQAEPVRTAPSGPGRPAMRVSAVTGMDPQGPRRYRALAEALALGLSDAPDAAEHAQRAGRAWGDRLAEPGADDPVAALVDLLDELGFAPGRTAPERIGLRNCPFLELADSARDVVCSVHLGLMRGALDRMDAGVDVTRLRPFVEPDLCVAHLGRTGRAATTR